jgi:sulfur-carrier protein
MSVTVRVPAPLRFHTDGAAEISVEAPTVFDALQAIGTHHPKLRPALMDRDGTPRATIAVYVNDVDIRTAQGVQTKLHRGDVIRLVPAIRGS